jgi:NAD(P)-dependent dehydrogenase (short-subunit alcohol dehydrogenase family)
MLYYKIHQINADVGRLACFSHTVDITDALAVKGAFESIVAQHGGVHILVNNAGVVAVGTLEKVSPASFVL